MPVDEICALIIDVGSRYLRIGYSGDERPSLVTSSHVGVGADGKQYFGDLALYGPVREMEIRPVMGATEGTSPPARSQKDPAHGRSA